MRPMAAVTTIWRQWRTAAVAAASSQRRMTAPPWTGPATFASVGPIQWVSTEREAETGRGSTAGRTIPGTFQRRPHGRHVRTLLPRRQGEDQQTVGQGRGSGRDPRLQLPGPAAEPPERQEGHRRPRDGEEAPPDAGREARAERREARHPGASGTRRRQGGPRAHGARAEDRGADRGRR